MRGYMKKTRNSHQNPENRSPHNIPNIHIIDLDNDDSGDPNIEGTAENDDDTMDQEPKKQGFHFGIHTAMHLVLLAVVVIVIIFVVYRITHLGVFISQKDILGDGEGTYDNTYDEILPAVDADGNIIITDTGEDLTILMLGNSPLSDDRDSEDGLANIIAERTGANVINCAVSGSYMAAQRLHFRADLKPMDVYTPYWLCSLLCTDSIDFYFEDALEKMGAEAPPEAREVFDTMSTLDMNTVDMVVFMYDGTDYLMGNGIFNDDNLTDIQKFTGNMEASIELLQNNFPHLRIIVMSPAYAFGIDENGDYISSDIQIYGGQHYLSSYVIKQYESCMNRSVTFVDNIYGTITEDNAREYLTDNIHLNVEGRKRMADRLIYALTYYDYYGY